MDRPLTAGVSLLFQSGGLLNAALLAAWDRSCGVGYAISCGNEAVLNIADYGDYLIRDENTRVLGLLTEGFRDPQKFLRVAKLAAELNKPIVVLKLGKSEKGGAKTTTSWRAFTIWRRSPHARKS